MVEHQFKDQLIKKTIVEVLVAKNTVDKKGS